MPVYEYKAVTGSGRMVTSKINIDGTSQDVKEQILKMGLKPISIKKKGFDAKGFLKILNNLGKRTKKVL